MSDVRSLMRNRQAARGPYGVYSYLKFREDDYIEIRKAKEIERHSCFTVNLV